MTNNVQSQKPHLLSIMIPVHNEEQVLPALFEVFGGQLGRVYEQVKNRPLFITREIMQAETEMPATPPHNH